MKKHAVWNFFTAVCLFMLIVLSCHGLAGREGSTDRMPVDKGDPFNSETGGAVLTFPDDHKLHNGAIMENENYQEWLYWTGFPVDTDDGAQLAIFFCLFRSFEKGAYVNSYTLTLFHPDKVLTKDVLIENMSASAGRTIDRKDSFVRYEGNGFAITHFTGADIWHVVVDNQKSAEGENIALDMKFTKIDQGYVAESPSGIAFQGAPIPGVTEYDQTTLRGLSYYYSAPRMSEVGTMTMGSKTIKVEDETGWFDHQWGGFRGDCNAFNYNWLGTRLNNGATFMLRDWHDTNRQSMGQYRRLAFFPKEGPPRYWQGTGAFELTEQTSYTSKGKKKRIWGLTYKLTSPEGNFYLEPISYQDYPSPDAYWEGAMRIRELNDDGTPGVIIGKTFLEQSQSN